MTSWPTSGFHDAHIHFTIDGKPADADTLQRLKNAYLANGITRVTDMGHASGIGLEIKKVWVGEIEVRTAGRSLYRAGGYGKFTGTGVSGVRDIVREVNGLARAGADFIKAVNSGIVLTDGNGSVSGGGFSADELRALVAEAAACGLSVSCHANGEGAIRQAVEAGVASIEHGFFITDEIVALMAERGCAWTPTANALLSVTAFVSEREAETIRAIVDGHLVMMRRAAAAGVSLRVGTDAGSKGTSHGRSFGLELELFRRAGLSPAAVVAAVSAAFLDNEKTDMV